MWVSNEMYGLYFCGAITTASLIKDVSSPFPYYDKKNLSKTILALCFVQLQTYIRCCLNASGLCLFACY